MSQEFINVVGIKFRNAGRIYYYNTGEMELKMGDKVIVNTPIGLGLGEVVLEPTLVPKEKAHGFNVLERKFDTDYVLANLSPATLDGSIDSEPKVPEQLDMVIRKATEDDIKNHKGNEEQAKKAQETCLKLIKSKKLPMKLVKTELSQNGKKAVFYFTSSSRVDFRDLVKDLLKDLKLRIELRQIDLRDETKIMGGIGCCGKTLCCATFLRQFKPVSIKMAKEQNLALNPTKVSGVCGRLLCCLAYELESYIEAKKLLPKVGNRVKTPDGEGKIIKVDIFSNKLDIILDSGEMAHFEAAQIKELGEDKKGMHETPEVTSMISGAEQPASEEELKALEDPDQVVDIKDTFMKPARNDNRQGQRSGQQNRPDDKNRSYDKNRPNGKNNPGKR
ncbi:MAG: regulatory iron-sulfur-containing complex subunit RicT [Proteobacteria bacterium]|nr:regulatory iron-sulfur-containing complex subunit RicT [Pseudomonadota bacterium]